MKPLSHSVGATFHLTVKTLDYTLQIGCQLV